jgi:hypothetical protein
MEGSFLIRLVADKILQDMAQLSKFLLNNTNLLDKALSLYSYRDLQGAWPHFSICSLRHILGFIRGQLLSYQDRT